VSDAELPCPACGAALEEVSAPDAVFHVCSRCAGVWIDNAVSTLLREAMLSREALVHANDAARRAAEHASAGPYRGAGTARTTERRCPVCSEMLSVVFLDAAALHLDVCAAHGTFLDEGELQTVYQTFEGERLSANTRRRAIAAIVKKWRPG
jgi:Zn-finger nucleic acid-binding protein